jgi:hypothetical protein
LGPASAKGPESSRRGEKSGESARTGPYRKSDALRFTSLEAAEARRFPVERRLQIKFKRV